MGLEPGAYYLTVKETKDAWLPEIGVNRDNYVRLQDKEDKRYTGFGEEIRVGENSVIEEVNVGMLPKKLKQARQAMRFPGVPGGGMRFERGFHRRPIAPEQRFGQLGLVFDTPACRDQCPAGTAR